MPVRLPFHVALLAIASSTAALAAQESTAAPAPRVSVEPAVPSAKLAAPDSLSHAPVAARAVVGVQLRYSLPAPSPKAPGPLSTLSATSTMIFGGAVFGVGVIVGGDVGRLLVISGAVIGLYGLYQFLK